MKNIAYILFSVLLIFVTSCKDEETIYHTAARPGFAVGEQYEVGESVTFTDATVPNEGTINFNYSFISRPDLFNPGPPPAVYP